MKITIERIDIWHHVLVDGKSVAKFDMDYEAIACKMQLEMLDEEELLEILKGIEND